MKRSRVIRSTVAWLAIVTALTTFDQRSAFAQNAGPPDSDQEANAQELAKKLVNPLTDLVSVPLQFNWINGIGPEKESRSLIYFQPVVPMSLSEDWNLIGRWVMPYLSQPTTFGGSSGLGDIIGQAFFSPKTSGTFTWGVGPMLYMPTTTDPTLGYGKWSGGPVVALMRQKGGMTYGMLWNNIWSFAGTGDIERPDVNMGYFQPVVAVTSRSGVTVTFSTEAIADWNAADNRDRWSVPVNLLVSKLTRFANTPMSVQVGAGYYVAKPTHGPDWQLRTTFTLLFPRRR
jgi:hypothetical protein